MKQLMFCNKKEGKLFVHYTIVTDVVIPVQDVVSPQKTTLSIPKTNMVEISDIVIIRDNDNSNIEYIGYIDTLVNKTTTEMSCYPLINVFDNDYVLDQMFERTIIGGEEGEEGEEGEKTETVIDTEIDAVKWLKTQIEREFVNTDDKLQALPFVVRNTTGQPVFVKKVIDTANLFEVYVDLFINNGLYIVFSGLSFNKNEIDGIYCDICKNTDENPYYLRYDNPTIYNVDIVDNTFTNYNKIIATEEISEEDLEKNPDLIPKRYYFYLLNNNEITTNPNDERRIKQVRSKEITFSIKDKDKTDKENAQALLLSVYNELQAPEYNLQITIEMLKNDDIRLYKRVDFLAESGIMYSSNITKIEIVKGSHIKVTLGALRNSLTDFKKKVEAI